MAEKIMTPKPGMTLGARNARYTHGQPIDARHVKLFNEKNLTEYHPPKKTLKKGMGLKVDGSEYKPGDLIKNEHVGEINPLFMEDWKKPEKKKVKAEAEAEAEATA